MKKKQQSRKSFSIDRNPAQTAQSILNFLNLQEQNLAAKVGLTLFTCTFSSLLSLKQTYKSYRLKYKISKFSLLHRLKFTFFSTYNLQTCISFSFKTFLDNLGIYLGIGWNQYHKGALVGLFSYMRNTPIKYIRAMQKMLKGKNRQKIDYYQVYSYLKQAYGQHIVYPGYFYLNLLNSALFFTLYFGVYSSLNRSSQHIAQIYIVNPFIATIVATIPNFLISKVANTIYSIKKSRQAFAISMDRKVMLFKNTILQQFFKNFRRNMKFYPQQKYMQLKHLTSSWMQLTFFVTGQTIIYHQLCKNGFISDKKLEM